MKQETNPPLAAADIQPLPAPPAERDPPDGSLVPVRQRVTGWTAAKQVAFIEHLAEHASVKAACAHVGMSEHSAYRLRRRPDAAEFRDAWAQAVRIEIERVTERVIDRAVNGDVRQRWRDGEVVGEERVYSDRLQLWLIQHGMAALERLDASRALDAGLPAPAALPPATPIRVWQDEENDMLRTNAALPPGCKAIDYDMRIAYGDTEVSRFLTPGEKRAWKERPDVKAAADRAEAARIAFFDSPDV